MATTRDHLRNIDRSAAEQTQLMKGIAFTGGASMVFNGITAANTARQARAQEEQVAIQHAQHALQQAAAERTATHEFAMWRQTAEGIAFVKWQRLATLLVPLLRRRDAAWHHAWARAIVRARAETPDEEEQRFRTLPARLQQNGLKKASVVCLVLAALFGVLFLGIFVPAMTAMATRGLGEGESAADVILFAVVFGLPVALFLTLTIVFVRLRSSRRRAAQTDPRLRDEQEARIERWGFDPLTTQAAWYAWYEAEKFPNYADRIERQALDGPANQPDPSQLIKLFMPQHWAPNPSFPAEVNEVLGTFAQENTALSS